MPTDPRAAALAAIEALQAWLAATAPPRPDLPLILASEAFGFLTTEDGSLILLE